MHRATEPTIVIRSPRRPKVYLVWAVNDLGSFLCSDWIDDGCPDDDHEIGSYRLTAESAESALEPLAATNVETVVASAAATKIETVVAGGEKSFAVYAGSPNEYKYRRGELKQRMNKDCMDEEQLERLRRAFRELYKLNKWPGDSRSYNSLAQVHQDHCQHGWERFVPWHRIYMYEFEQALQDHCPDVTMPYWDWTMPQYCPSHPEKGWRIPRALQAYLTDASIDYLQSAKPELPPREAETLRKNLVGRCLADRVYFPSQKCFFRHRGGIDRRAIHGRRAS